MEGCICPNALGINFYFRNLTCWRYKGFKNLVSDTVLKKCVAYGTLIFLELSYLQQSNLKEKMYCQNIGGKYTVSIAVSSFCIKLHVLTQEHFKVAKIFTLVPSATNFPFTDNSKFSYILKKCFYFQVMYKLWLRLIFNTNQKVFWTESATSGYKTVLHQNLEIMKPCLYVLLLLSMCACSVHIDST